jgi:glycosyltransferase involved in cell wall biosynthesis
VLHLVEDIMPYVWAECPEAKVCIVGQNPPGEIKRLGIHHAPRVVVTGTVPDVRPYRHRAAAAAVSLTYGAGSQFKVMEAMACATPVVATPQAVSALDVEPDEQVLVADGAAAFANAILRLLHDRALAERLGKAGRRYVEAHHDWNVIAAQLELIYEEVLATRDRVESLA